MATFNRIFFIATFFLLLIASISHAQVNTVVYGRNRVQYKKFKWKYYHTKNFDTYFSQDGQELAKYVAQMAEEELPQIESFTEYSLQRSINIVIYNSYNDYLQTNIGLGTSEPTASGITKLVNNKMVVYFNGDHSSLRKQIRYGIARTLTDNVLFGNDLGEFASNQTLLDLPKWLTDGYVAFAAENWSTSLDDQLKSEILSNKYKNFYAFSFDKPELAGHAFWYYIEQRYKKENVTYLLYLARVYKNLNKASNQVCKKKFKEVLADFMEYEEDNYDKDIAKRKAYPKGYEIESYDIDKRHDYYRINVNPNKNNNSYALVEYKKGIVRLKIHEDDQVTTLLKYGILSYQNETDPDYPLMAWDPKGTRLAVVYSEEGKLKLFVYDLINRVRFYKTDLTDTFNMVQDVKYMLDSRTLLVSAVKNGHSDIYTIELESGKIHQVTNDVYDDLDPSFVAFPNKTGIIFSSNRPSPGAKGGDTSLPSNNHYNVFLITNYGGKPELNQITQLSNLKYGDARFPSQYNNNHFTFISDENGVGNRYAGFFTTKSAGLDTLVLINGDILRNPSEKEVDSALRVHKKTDVDSVAVIAVSEDSAYTFPLTNYESSVAETRIAGDNSQVSEVTRESDEKILYKLKIDENVLHRRNVTVPPTEYMKRVVIANKVSQEKTAAFDKPLSPGTDTAKKQNDIFQNEFENEKQDTSNHSNANKQASSTIPQKENVLRTAKLYVYKPVKFYVDYGAVGFDNNVLFNQYQAYQNGQGPIQMGSSTALNGQINIGTSELMEDQKFTGAFRLSTNLKDNEWLLSYQNYKRRFDWGLTYYRNVLETFDDTILSNFGLNTKTITNIGQINIAYPFDRARRLSLSLGIRNDRIVYETFSFAFPSLIVPDVNRTYATSHMEYVYDNTLNPAQNIWNGLRYKFFIDWNTDISKAVNNTGKFNFNWGFDARYYAPIYRNFIWAGRASGAFSWGSQKTIYYAGGEDGWFNPQFNNNQPAPDQTYAFQALAVNLRGFNQNIANGNNSLIINSEFRLPVITTFFNRPVNNSFLNNFQLIQFIDLGNAWNGNYNSLKRPQMVYNDGGSTTVIIKAGGIGPFAGGYGFGARSSLLGYYLKLDAAWPMIGLFRGSPIWYFSMGLDF